MQVINSYTFQTLKKNEQPLANQITFDLDRGKNTQFVP